MREATFLERLAENLLEGGFVRILKPKLQPVQIAKALAREMDRSQVVAAGAPLVANRYVVRLHPDDLALFSDYQAALERELSAYLRDYAVRRGFRPVAAPTVALLPGTPEARRGRVAVAGSLVDVKPDPVTVPSPPPPVLEGTFEMPLPRAVEVEAPSRPPASLVDEAGRSLDLLGAVTTLGRAVDNDVVLEARGISRHHGRIAWDSGRYVLIDLDSTNGTLVSGRKVDRHPLSDGDEISFGGAVFKFRIGREPLR